MPSKLQKAKAAQGRRSPRIAPAKAMHITARSNTPISAKFHGGDGVADHVEIMAVRAVPDGDEYDKDIALAIRYAVDNGAKVINGSFGKNYSPHKQWVFDAIKYAEKKDVLFVHAAGNDGQNIDLPENASFPNDSDDNIKEFASNVLTVGALNYEYGSTVLAPFSFKSDITASQLSGAKPMANRAALLDDAG